METFHGWKQRRWMEKDKNVEWWVENSYVQKTFLQSEQGLVECES